MSSRLRIGVLGSTKGTDMQAVIDAIEAGLLNAGIAVVVSNVQDAYILERARRHGIKAVFVDRKKFPDNEGFNAEILKVLKENGVELVLLIGYMKIVREPLLSAYPNRMMNIHPSLLPKYGGGMDLNVHEEVLKNRDKETGCTLHFVTPELDSGPIIMQKKVRVAEGETVDSLKAKVQKAEQEVIVKAIKLFSKHKLVVEDNKVRILG